VRVRISAKSLSLVPTAFPPSQPPFPCPRVCVQYPRLHLKLSGEVRVRVGVGVRVRVGFNRVIGL